MADINLGVGGANSATGGYEIANSLKLEADNTEYLQKANDSGTNRKTFTVSMWFKRTELSNDYMQLWQGGANGEATRLGFYGGTPKEAIWVDIGGGSGNTGTLYRSYSTQVLRDTSAWYHIVLAVDTTQATEADRFRLWLNGSEVTDWSQRQYPAQNFQCALEASINMTWGAYNATYYKMSGYIAECHYLDGVAKVQTDFGEYDEDSGIWIPKEYTGSYGGNGCYLDFESSGSLGADSSGNGNNFTLNNITSADQATDTPTNNFCTWNPLYAYSTNPTLTEGATKTQEGTGTWAQAKATMGVTSGKWYWEYKMGGSISFMGVQDDTASQTEFAGQYSLLLYNGDTTVEINDTGSLRDDTVLSYTFSTSNIYAVALNMDDNEISYYQNGSIIGSAISLDGLANRLLLPYIGTNSSTNETNFGGYTTISISTPASDANGYGTFEYAPPSGYYALCTKNLARFG